jgi:hypothetical protein
MTAPRTLLLPLSLSLLVAACASAPRPGAAPAAPAAPATATAPAAATTPRFVAPVNKLTGDQIVALQKQGYKLVDSNGTPLFCLTENKTGSRLQKDNICMTEQEMVMLHERTQRDLENVERQVHAAQGN